MVLAGCATAGTYSQEPWGSLAGSFLASGSASVVASLWSVDDAAAARLISLFYQQANHAKNPAAALAASQRILLVGGNAPSLWAPFVAIGN